MSDGKCVKCNGEGLIRATIGLITCDECMGAGTWLHKMPALNVEHSTHKFPRYADEVEWWSAAAEHLALHVYNPEWPKTCWIYKDILEGVLERT